VDYVVVKPYKRTDDGHCVETWCAIQWEDGQETAIALGVSYLSETLKVAEDTGLPVHMFYECVVCGCSSPQEYMVLDAVWHAAGLGPGRAHLICLEKQLGRRLTVDDFKRGSPANEAVRFGYQLPHPPPPPVEEMGPAKIIGVEHTEEPPPKYVTVQWYCGLYVGPPKWRGTEHMEPDECPGEGEAAVLGEEWEGGVPPSSALRATGNCSSQTDT